MNNLGLPPILGWAIANKYSKGKFSQFNYCTLLGVCHVICSVYIDACTMYIPVHNHYPYHFRNHHHTLALRCYF